MSCTDWLNFTAIIQNLLILEQHINNYILFSFSFRSLKTRIIKNHWYSWTVDFMLVNGLVQLHACLLWDRSEKTNKHIYFLIILILCYHTAIYCYTCKMCFTCCDVICDLLQYTCIEKCYLFVLYNCTAIKCWICSKEFNNFIFLYFSFLEKPRVMWRHFEMTSLG